MDPTEDGCGRQRSTCHCFRDCADITDKEFQKIVELEDAGVALYRYVPPNLDPTQNIGEVYILRTDDEVELEPDEFTMTFAKNKISCPRCIRLIEKAEKLFNDLPSVKQQDVAGVCDHCWKPVAKMQRLAELARKERDVRDPAAVDALQSQMLHAMGTEDVKKRFKAPKQRPTTPKGPRPQFDRMSKEKDQKEEEETIEKEESQMSYELKQSAKERRHKSPIDKSKDERLKAKEEKQKGKEDKSKGKEDKPESKEDKPKAKEETPEYKSKDKDAKSKDKEGRSKDKESKSKDQEDKSKDKESKSKDKEDKSKDKESKSKDQEDKSKGKEVKPKDREGKSKDKEEKSKDKEEKEKRLPRKTMSGGELKQQLAQMAKEKQESEQRKKQQQQEKELAERKAKEAERVKAIEREKNKEAKFKQPKLQPETEDDDEDEVRERAVYKAPTTNDMIIGEKICKNRRPGKSEEIQDQEKPGKSLTQKLIKAGKGPMGDSEKYNKVLNLNKSKGEKLTKDKPGQNSSKDIGQQEVNKSGKEESKINKSSKSTSETSGIAKSAASGKQKTTNVNTRADDGIIRYALSDRTFIDKGWTMLPLEKVVRKMNVYRMRPAHPEFDWFEHNKNRRLLEYDSGQKLAEIDDSGRGRWYYRSGKLAMDYYDAEETNAGQRFVVYSTGTPDERGRPRPRTVLATFDYLGNGIVFDHTGKIRLKYNQTEGVVLDRDLGPVSHWKWHTLNDPPVLQQVMIDTQMSHKDPTIMSMGDPRADPLRLDDDAMLAIEFDNFVKEKTKKSSQDFKPFQIKMKALKINEHFSLRVLDQASVYLLFRDGSANIKINIGMVLDHKEIVDTDTAEIGEVSNKMDKLPACTNSIGDLQKAVAHARALEGLRALSERRLRAPVPCASVDIMRAPASRRLRTPLACSVTSHIKSISITPTKPPCSCDCFNNPLF